MMFKNEDFIRYALKSLKELANIILFLPIYVVRYFGENKTKAILYFGYSLK